jgi:hypothetical protein
LDGTGMTKEDPEWEAERNPCRNVALQRKEEKLLFEAPSDVAGMQCVADPGCLSRIRIFSPSRSIRITMVSKLSEI